MNAIDVKLEQEEFGKYLSNACLFWVASTLNKTKVVGLNNTFSYGSDENVTFGLDDSSLTHVNAVENTISKYNRLLNEMYGAQMQQVITSEFVIFNVDKDNVLAFTGNIKWINALYGNFNVKVRCDKSMVRSWMLFLLKHIRSCKWKNIVLDRF